MAIYQQTVREIKIAAQSVNPHGAQDHGRIVDLSQDYAGDYPRIFLYPWKIQDPRTPGDFIYTHPLIIGFYERDKPESLNHEREDIIHRMELLKDAFMLKLAELYPRHRISNVISEPQYQMHNGTVSGFAVSFNYENYDPCQ